MRKLKLLLLTLPVVAMNAAAQTAAPVTPVAHGGMSADGDEIYLTTDYTNDTTVIANPERGTIHQQELHATRKKKTYNLTKDEVGEWRTKEKKTLVRMNVYLEDFVNNPTIRESYIDTIRTNLNAIRDGGAKCILRFAYTDDSGKKPWDAPMDVISKHISQLKTEILDSHSDVISVLEAGFLGVWGEWYYTSHDGKADRKAVLTQLLDAMPQNRFVSVRAPSYKYNVFDRTSADYTTETTAYDGSDYSRVGAFNDAFIASDRDMGSFGSNSREGGVKSDGADADRTFWAIDTKFGPMGGESTEPDKASDVNKFYTRTLTDLAKYHYTYINEEWYDGFVNKWKSTVDDKTALHPGDTYWNTMEKRLGYRFTVTGARITKTVGDVLHVEMDVRNDGYATPYNPRPLKVVLLSENGGSYDVAATLDATADHNAASPANANTDVRRWWSGATTKVSMWLSVSGLDAGQQYAVAIELPDEDATLARNDAYSIRFANVGTWLQTAGRGFNLIGSTTAASVADGIGSVPAVSPSASAPAPVYNVAGQRVAPGYKGLVISRPDAAGKGAAKKVVRR